MKCHITTEDATKIVEEISPEMTVITHFGMQMILKGPTHEARIIKKKPGSTLLLLPME